MAGIMGWKKESDLQGDFTRWIRGTGSEGFRSSIFHGKTGGAAAFELKLVRGVRSGSLAYGALEEGQRDALLRVVGVRTAPNGVVTPLAYKISDSGIGYKPFDCFVMQGCVAGVVVGYGDGCGSASGKAWFVGIEELESERWRGERGSWALEAIVRLGKRVLV